MKDNKQRLFEVMSKVDKTFKYNLNEYSTGYAQKAYGTTERDKWGGSNPEITQRKAMNQMEKFAQYINPELKKYVMGKFADVQGFEMYSTNGREIVLYFPILGKQNIEGVKIAIGPETSKVIKVVTDKNGGRPEELEGGSELLPPNYLSILPTIIKRIQADIRGEKSQYNPAKPAPEPIPEPVAEPAPVQEPAKPSGFFNKIKDRFK